jgi:hypothetical protein
MTLSLAFLAPDIMAAVVEGTFQRGVGLARAGPVAVAKHGRPVVVVMAIEEYERLRALEGEMRPASGATRTAKAPRKKVGG